MSRNTSFNRYNLKCVYAQESDLFNLLNVVSRRVENSTLNSLPGVKKIIVTWSTYCPTKKQTITSIASDPIEIIWPNTLTAAIVKPHKDILCVYGTNRVESLTGQCLANFTHGASISLVVDVEVIQLIFFNLHSSLSCLQLVVWI